VTAIPGQNRRARTAMGAEIAAIALRRTILPIIGHGQSISERCQDIDGREGDRDTDRDNSWTGPAAKIGALR